eukprot:jgi/Tetstr1/465016/TSEL_009746.t1
MGSEVDSELLEARDSRLRPSTTPSLHLRRRSLAGEFGSQVDSELLEARAPCPRPSATPGPTPASSLHLRRRSLAEGIGSQVDSELLEARAPCPRPSATPGPSPASSLHLRRRSLAKGIGSQVDSELLEARAPRPRPSPSPGPSPVSSLHRRRRSLAEGIGSQVDSELLEAHDCRPRRRPRIHCSPVEVMGSQVDSELVEGEIAARSPSQARKPGTISEEPEGETAAREQMSAADDSENNEARLHVSRSMIESSSDGHVFRQILESAKMSASSGEQIPGIDITTSSSAKVAPRWASAGAAKVARHGQDSPDNARMMTRKGGSSSAAETPTACVRCSFPLECADVLCPLQMLFREAVASNRCSKRPSPNFHKSSDHQSMGLCGDCISSDLNSVETLAMCEICRHALNGVECMGFKTGSHRKRMAMEELDNHLPCVVLSARKGMVRNIWMVYYPGPEDRLVLSSRRLAGLTNSWERFSLVVVRSGSESRTVYADTAEGVEALDERVGDRELDLTGSVAMDAFLNGV